MGEGYKFYFFAFLVVFADIRCVLASEPMAAPMPWKLPPVDTVRHGATRQVFDKLVNDYKARPYKVKSDEMKGQCIDLLAAFRDGRATWVEPKINSDDYNDARFEPYKRKFKEAVSKSKNEWKGIPGADWFGGRLAMRYEALERPTRNFALYEIDVDGDKAPEVIFYGEFVVRDTAGKPGESEGSHPIGGPSDYKVYKDYVVNNAISVPSEYDFEKNVHLDNFSILFNYKSSKFIASAYLGSDFTLTSIDEIGWFDGLNNRKVPFQTRCEFSVE